MAEINENGQDDTSLQDEFDGEADTEQAEAEVTAANPDESGIEDPVLIYIYRIGHWLSARRSCR